MTFILAHWPLWFICVAMIFAAVIDGWKLKVPNWLTFPLILSGWVLGICHNFGLLDGTGEGTFGASLAGTFLGFILLYPIHAIGGMGAGDVKMQMGFGAWVGSFYGLSPSVESRPGALWIILTAFCLAVVIGGFLAAIMIFVRGQYRRNLDNTRAILGDLFGKGATVAAEKAADRKPKMHLLPYGIPLCLGFVSYLLYLHSL